ncbi:DNA-binding CsgD family transcriptional regulator/tetratricopeptide (TPR) repeat protein [Okibacterium sp. HSC-33S16]|uniref:helix-turn-helix transcriptional regulator n=1 Tax=Okibacterium sp. HSC-33S16 TaxID=2910965 RepID=UPI00209CA3FB|nr:helix-turn-helix transcriptional regulator [Okibacterium sp. HSC-33S16]MCP2030960.1 DNA-binding CsgD family transcriptional regulator/tetratricopeptide (TPR) repeat protein [Okibacterium sp. HSC-33S16]
MIGRESELARLRSVFAATRDGRPQGVVVSGEAGIGKTRLLEEFRAFASTEALVLTGQCVDLGAVAAPYSPIQAVLRSLVAAVGADTVLDAGGPGGEALAALVPELAARTPDAATGRLNRVHDAVATVLETVSRQTPLVVLIEDLHWADEGTLDLLRFLLRVLGSGRILVVLSFRTEDVSRGHPLRALLSELDRSRSVTRVELARLTRDDVRRQVTQILGAEPDEEAFDRVHARSEGVPFFVEELVGFDASGEGELPWTLRELLLARYERLSDEAQHLLRLISAGGVRVDHTLLSSVFPGDADQLDSAAREAVLAHILVADERSYAFRHALVREAIHSDLLPGERARFHTRFAEALEAISAEHRVAAEVSYHWMAAHDAARAFPASLAAMSEARASYAYGTAAQMGERALELWDSVPNAETVAERKKIDLLAQTASALRNAGEGERSLAMINLALDECPRDEALRYARLLRDKALYLGNVGKPGSIPLLRQALELVPPGAEGYAGTSGLAGTTMSAGELRSGLLTALASRLMLNAHFDEAIITGKQALAEAHRAGSDRHASIASNVLGSSEISSGLIAEGRAHLNDALVLSETDTSARLRYRVNASDAEFLLGHSGEALCIAELGIERARELGVERSSGIILKSNAVDPLIALGQWDRADAFIDSAIRLLPSPTFNAYLNRARIFLLTWRGETDAAFRLYRSVRTSLRELGEVEMQVKLGAPRVAAELLLAQNAPDEAWDEVSILFESDHRAVPGYELPLLAVAARTLAALRRAATPPTADNAEARIRALLQSVSWWPTADLWTAIVDAELSGGTGTGNDPDAWQRVVDRVATDPASQAHLPAYAALRQAQALVETGDRTAAAPPLRDAWHRAEALGAGLVSRQAREVADRAGLSLTPGRRSADATDLTARERQVLDLLGQGLSNRQIGERLFISAKTASVHVSAILRKLGASSRTEAVFLAREPV